jgi:hypothetical protein
VLNILTRSIVMHVTSLMFAWCNKFQYALIMLTFSKVLFYSNVLFLKGDWVSAEDPPIPLLIKSTHGQARWKDRRFTLYPQWNHTFNFFSFFSPEAMGVLCGAVYLICVFVFIPFPFWKAWWENGANDFPHHEVMFHDIKYLCWVIHVGRSWKKLRGC